MNWYATTLSSRSMEIQMKYSAGSSSVHYVSYVICHHKRRHTYLLNHPLIERWVVFLMFYWHSTYGLHSGNKVVSILPLLITQPTYGILVVHLSTAVLQRRTDGIVIANGLMLLWIIVLFSLYILATYYIRFLLMVYLFMVRSSIYSEYEFLSNFCQREIWRPLYCNFWFN